jgi:hypothetical protein
MQGYFMLQFAACGGQKEGKVFFRDTPNPGRDTALPAPSLVPKNS